MGRAVTFYTKFVHHALDRCGEACAGKGSKDRDWFAEGKALRAYRHRRLPPTIDAQVNLSVSVSARNVPGAFTGKVSNSSDIGMSSEEMAQLWNEEHPADLMVLETEPEPQP